VHCTKENFKGVFPEASMKFQVSVRRGCGRGFVPATINMIFCSYSENIPCPLFPLPYLFSTTPSMCCCFTHPFF